MSLVICSSLLYQIIKLLTVKRGCYYRKQLNFYHRFVYFLTAITRVMFLTLYNNLAKMIGHAHQDIKWCFSCCTKYEVSFPKDSAQHIDAYIIIYDSLCFKDMTFIRFSLYWICTFL